MPTLLGLGYAIEYNDWLGRANKEARLRHLRRHWTGQLADLDGVYFRTPLDEDRCCVIVNVSIPGREPAQLEKHLFDAHQLHVQAIVWENMPGIRITPNVYTSPRELDALVKALREEVGA
jgi:selenocysteine lyase/cysteine desulfurase